MAWLAHKSRNKFPEPAVFNEKDVYINTAEAIKATALPGIINFTPLSYFAPAISIPEMSETQQTVVTGVTHSN
jgi:hypothetical protein